MGTSIPNVDGAILQALTRRGFDIPSYATTTRLQVQIPNQGTKTYAKKTFQDLLNYMFEKSVEAGGGRQPSAQWKNLASYVYRGLKEDFDSESFNRLLDRYPNLAAYHREKEFPIPGWETLPSESDDD